MALPSNRAGVNATTPRDSSQSPVSVPSGKIQADRVVHSVHKHLLRTLPPAPAIHQQQPQQHSAAGDRGSGSAMEAALRRALSRLSVVRCYSSKEFVQALAVADRLFPPDAAAGAGAAGTKMLLVDNIVRFLLSSPPQLPPSLRFALQRLLAASHRA